MENITPKLEEQKEWYRAVVFTDETKIMGTKNCNPSE